ncbi:PREDICTED: uncharacterized protein LOC106297211 [Brassica oleracea var. oleracea]|uniref:uncharacterized protein LOC106297211 n=1 Tax=Brassica oleracea var. oleracea TaxID=109376 RepID=UPI0006A6B32E|nr:PREDICTED: uncharacterized protein LOC106297211 [Brassica oleracea var. oleracea]
MNTYSVQLAYLLPEAMMQRMAPDTPPIHVTSDRQVRNLLEIAKMHEVRLCVSSLSKMIAVSEEAEEDDEWDEADEGNKADEVDEDDDDMAEDENHDGDEDVDIPVVAEAVDDAEDYNFKGTGSEGGRSYGSKIYVNQSFASKDALVSELRLTAVRRKFFFRIYKSTKTLLVATCRVNGCGWEIRASVKHGTNTFWVTKYVETHTCYVGDRIAQRKHCTPKYIGRLFIDRVGIIDGLNPQHIKDVMKNVFGMTLDYTTSYRALLYAQELVRGSAADGYERLPSYLEQISLANLGSITGLELDSLNRFKYLFLSFGYSIRGFQYQRRVIVVDGTHLSGKYEGVMFVAAAQDGNFQIFSDRKSQWKYLKITIGFCDL